MSWFRRKTPKPARPAPGPVSPPVRHERAARTFDWRSYDAVAKDYARIHGAHTAVVAADVLQRVGAGPGKRILDVGTGTGDALAAAEQSGSGGVVVGVDSAPGMLRFARPGHLIAAAEVINLPFRDATFDGAMANFALPYFTKLDTSLFDVRRVLKPGGILGVAVWGADEDDLTKTWRLLVEEAIGRDILKAGLKDEAPWAERLSDRQRLETALRDAGFRPVTVEAMRYKFQTTRDDYIIGHEIEAAGRYTKVMLGERLWPGFQQRVRAAYEEKFPEQLVDFRDVLIAVASKPSR
ncbi:MAG TPA: methyltransferase domain-containing protein [Actinomycetota bacterium]